MSTTLHNRVHGVSPLCSEMALYNNVQHVALPSSQSTLYHHLCLLTGLGILLVVISGGKVGRKSFITFYYCVA